MDHQVYSCGHGVSHRDELSELYDAFMGNPHVPAQILDALRPLNRHVLDSNKVAADLLCI